MVNEHNAFDLSKLIDKGDNASRIADNRDKRIGLVDLSGRPAPKDVRVKLNSGVVVKCDVRYDGVDMDGQRRFVVIAEIDWENYHPTVMTAAEYPRDATLIFRIPGLPDADAAVMASRMMLQPERIIEVS